MLLAGWCEAGGRLDADLDRLMRRVCCSTGHPAAWSYLFKHALVQDGSYGTLLREPRRVLHAGIAENPSKLSSQKSPRASPSCWRVTTQRPA